MVRRFKIPPKALLVVLGCLVCQMGAGLFYATRALAPDVIGDLGWTRTMWSSAMAPMLLVSSVAQGFVGLACVRFGVRPVVMASLVCLAATFVVIATMQSLWHFYIAMILLALGNAGIGDVSIGGVITRWFNRNRSLALGFAFVGTNLGAVVFVYAIAKISADFDWRSASAVVGLGGVALILPVAFFLVRDPMSGEGEQWVGSSGIGDSAEPLTKEPVSLSLRPAMRRPTFWILFYTIFCYALVQLGMFDHLMLYLTDLGYSREEAASALELAVGAGIVSKVGAGIIAMRIPAKTALIANTALMTLSLSLVPFAADPRILTVFGILFGVSASARDVLVPLVVGDAFGAKFFTQIYGVMMLAFFPGGGLGPIGLARVHDLLGTYRPGFFACVLLMGTALLGLVFVKRSSQTDREVKMC